MLSQKKGHRNGGATVFLNCCNLICFARFELVSKVQRENPSMLEISRLII
jgi:hypothetical protein